MNSILLDNLLHCETALSSEMQIKSQVAKSFGQCLARVGCAGVNGSIILYNILQPSFTEYVSFVLRYPETKDRFLFVCLFVCLFFNLVISVISVVLRETTLSISVSSLSQ